MTRAHTKPPATPPAPTVAKLPSLNLRLGYYILLNYTQLEFPEQEPLVWFEDRADVWFDNDKIGWRARAVKSPFTGYEGSVMQKQFSPIGYDPMDAVDQLAHLLDVSHRMEAERSIYTPGFTDGSDYGNLSHRRNEGEWDKRVPMETDGLRGYGPTFKVSPYHYSLEAEYSCQVVNVNGRWFAWHEDKDGVIRSGLEPDPREAVISMAEDIGHMIRVPGTDVTLPKRYAVGLGIRL